MSPDHWHTAPASELDMCGNHTTHPTVRINFVLRQEREKQGRWGWGGLLGLLWNTLRWSMGHSEYKAAVSSQLSSSEVLSSRVHPPSCNKNKSGFKWSKRMVQLGWRISELSLADKLPVNQSSKDTEIKPQSLPESNLTVWWEMPPSGRSFCYPAGLQTECTDIREWGQCENKQAWLSDSATIAPSFLFSFT